MTAEPTTGDGAELVTVVVPARNEIAHLGACLDALRAQTHRELQVVVVDGGSTDGTRELVLATARVDPRIELVDNPRQVIPVAMNLGLGAARGRWLVRIDAHCTVSEDYVARAVGWLRTGRYGGVGGRKDGVGHTHTGRAIAAAMGSRFGVGDSLYHYGTEVQVVDHVPFGAYPTALARATGGWDEQLLANQDYEFDQRVRRAGHELLFDPRLRIDWVCRQSLAGLWRQYRRYGRGKARVVRTTSVTLRTRHLVAPAFVAWSLATGLVALAAPKVALLAQAPYLLGLAGASVLTARSAAGWRARALLPAVFPTMHVAWGVGFLEGWLAGRAPATSSQQDTPDPRPVGGR